MWKYSQKNLNSRKIKILTLAIATLLFAFLQSHSAVATTIVKQGIKVDFSLTSLKEGAEKKNVIANSDAYFNFNITDTSGAPVSGAYPLAWLQRRAKSIPSDEKTCKNMVKSFIGGSLFAQPTLNLNTYYVMVMNDDSTISVVDPLFHFGGTNLLTMIPLSSPGYDWVMSEQQQRLFVSLPKSKRIAIVDTASSKLLNEIELAHEPGRIALQEDEQYLWFSVKNGISKGGVNVINTETNQVVKEFDLGTGEHLLAFSANNQFVFVANAKSNNVTVIDIAQMKIVKTIETGKEASSIVYAPAADAIYITHRGDGKIISINARTLVVNSRIDLDPGIEHLKFAPNGRHGVVVNPLNDKVYIIDSLNDVVTKSGRVESGPDQVNFGDTLAYIRHRSSESVFMIPMDAIVDKNVKLQVIDFPGGESGFGIATTPAAGIIQAPGESAVLIAHPSDEQIYYYKEGMAAPMGSFKNYGRKARAVISVDRSLREQSDGVYQTVGRMGESGTYDVAFFMDSPRVIHCFEVRVAPNLDKPQDAL